MKVKKRVRGQDVELEVVLIKDYPNYGLYQIYKVVNGKHIPLYQQSFTKQEIQEIIKTNYISDEESCV